MNPIDQADVLFKRMLEAMAELPPQYRENILDALWRSRADAMGRRAAAEVCDFGNQIMFHATDIKGRDVCGVLYLDVAYKLASAIGLKLSEIGYEPEAAIDE